MLDATAHTSCLRPPRWTRLGRALWAALAASGTAFAPTLAQAGNSDTFYLSGKAMLRAGAISATAEGGGAIWYNPAGLAHLPGLRLDVSVSSYAVRFGGHPDIDPGTPNADVKRLLTMDFNIVPASLTLTKELGPVGLGFGVFVPTQQTTFLRTQVVARNPEGAVDVLELDFYRRQQDYYAGPSIGFALSPVIDLGASLFFQYRNELAIGSSAVSLTLGEATSNVLIHETLDWQQIAAELVLGAQLHPNERWDLGFTLRLPSWRFFKIQQTVSQQLVAATGAEVTGNRAESFEEELGYYPSIITPARGHFAVSHRGESFEWSAELSYQLGLKNDELQVDWAPIVDAKLGAQTALSPNVSVGGGLFTDFSPQRRVRQLGDYRLDFYGATVAFDFTDRYHVARERSATPITSLLFGTTVGLSYAVALGKTIRGAFAVAGGALFEEVPTDVVAHEISLHVASTLAE